MATDDRTPSPVHEAVHNVTLTQSARISLQGRAIPTQQVQYYVGSHGPFTDNYDLDTFTPEQAQQGILERVHTIQQLTPNIPGPIVLKHIPPPIHPPGGSEPIQPSPIFHKKGTEPPILPIVQPLTRILQQQR